MIENQKKIIIIYSILLSIQLFGHAFFGQDLLLLYIPLGILFIWLWYPIFSEFIKNEPIRFPKIFTIFILFCMYGVWSIYSYPWQPIGYVISILGNFILMLAVLFFSSRSTVNDQYVKTYYTPEKSGYRITIKDIDKMEGTEFESFLKKLFEKMGYSVELTSHTNDMGADLILSKQGERISVQAKRWIGNVPGTAIQEVVGSLKCYKTQRGIVVTNSEFTNQVIKMAHHNHVELWNRDKLNEMLNKYSIIK